MSGDEKVTAELNLPEGIRKQIEQAIQECEREMDDDAESIITNQRYAYISKLVSTCVRKGKPKGSLTTSDKIDRVVTNRWLALPIFVAVMAPGVLHCRIQHRHHRHRLYQ